ncbi:MAG: prenyltransferase [Pseudomonadota bacterium]
MTFLTYGDQIPDRHFDGARARILDLQRVNGAIPWYDGGVIDPWNHTEAAMGLTVIGEIERARLAFKYLQETQLGDGSWWGQLGAAVPFDDEAHYKGGDEGAGKPIRDTNFVAYIATGAWHHFLITRDRKWLSTIWPNVEAAIKWVVAHQSPHGDIRWAANDPHTPENDALVTGSSSIYKSIECAIHIANELRVSSHDWAAARVRLGEALREKPHRFDRTWESKARYSMDWYYPVLAGVITGEAARRRLAAKWDTFVVDGKGCRCVSDQPWVTIAESAELTMALLVAGERKKAEDMLAWQHQWRDNEGAYWMGYQFEESVAWPAEKPAWTAAAVILATDAITGATPASRLFSERTLAEAAE